MIIESQSLLITIRTVFLPAILMTSNSWLLRSLVSETTLIWRIHSEEVDHLLGVNMWLRSEFNKWQSIKTDKISYKCLPTTSTVISLMVDQ